MYYKLTICLSAILMVALLPLTLQATTKLKPLTENEKFSIFERDLQAIEGYLNDITTIVSRFSQIAPDGSISEGTFYLSRPGRLRWEYDPPTPITIIAKGSMLTYYDAELDQLSHVSIDDTLAGFLTRKHISFDDGVEITKFSKKDGDIHITLIHEGKPDEGQLTLTFNEEITEFLQMNILDPSGQETLVSFTTSVAGKPIDKKLFTLPKLRGKKKR